MKAYNQLVYDTVEANFDMSWSETKDNISHTDLNDLAIHYWYGLTELERRKWLSDDDIQEQLDTLICSMSSYDSDKMIEAMEDFRQFLSEFFEARLFEDLEDAHWEMFDEA